MSFQWTFIAAFLYFEIFLVIFLLLPFITPTRWQSVFRSRLLTVITGYSNLYFNVLIVILLILFMDAIREMRRYSAPFKEVDLQTSPYAESSAHMKLFRAQRNFYIAGFSLFLWLVLRRLVTLISTQASLIANAEASRKQAESATAAAKQMLEDNDKLKGDSVTEEATRTTLLQDKLNTVVQDLSEKERELERMKVDLASMKKQAEATNAEYDRLLSVHEELQKRVGETCGEDKKDI